MYKKAKLLFLIIVFLFPLSSQAAWRVPAANPVSDNDLGSFIDNDLGDNSIYILNNPFGIGGTLTVGNSNLFIDVNLNRVGVGTNTPLATLEVDGIVRIPQDNYSDFPICTVDLEGTFMFNLDQDRLNICVNGAWRRIGYDGDLDGWLGSSDCNDNDLNIYPGRSEICGDDVDDNCDGSLTIGCNLCYYDDDLDGYGDVNNYVWVNPSDPCPSGYITDNNDCNDDDFDIKPGVTEICNNSVDENCDGSLTSGCVVCYHDGDNDGYGDTSDYLYLNSCNSDYISISGDCDDSDPNRNPGSEVCGDSISNDCDTSINEGCFCTSVDWSAAVCPDMSSCTTEVTAYGIKETACSGTDDRPSIYCECICRTESWDTSCPECGPAGTYQADLKSWYSCVDTNNTRPSFWCPAASCPAPSSGSYCGSGQTYLKLYSSYTTYSCISNECVANTTSSTTTCDPDPVGMSTGACYGGACVTCYQMCGAGCSYCSVGGWGLDCWY